MKLSILAIGITLLASPAAAERLPLAALAHASELVAIGRVARLQQAGDGLFVEFDVEQSLKGGPLSTVSFIAPALWSEPAFSNQEGRHLLVFLYAGSPTETGVAARTLSLVAISPDRLAYFQIFESNGIEFVTIWSDDLELPAEIDVSTLEIAPDFIQNVPLRPLLASLSRILNDLDRSPNPSLQRTTPW